MNVREIERALDTPDRRWTEEDIDAVSDFLQEAPFHGPAIDDVVETAELAKRGDQYSLPRIKAVTRLREMLQRQLRYLGTYGS